MVVGCGGVAMYASGQFRGASCKAYPGIVDPLTSEALALRDVVVFAQSHNFSRIMLETDYSGLVRLWDSRRRNRPMVAPLHEEISVLSLGFQTSSISFACGSANSSGHECARYACLHNLSGEWPDASHVFL
jgi:hypothetical protein